MISTNLPYLPKLVIRLDRMYPKNEIINRKYTHLMYEIKKLNRELFWCQNYKRVFLLKYSRLPLMSKLINKISPYDIMPHDIITPNYFLDERIAIYTSVFGDYVKINEPFILPDNCDFFIISDSKPKNSNWKHLNLDISNFGLLGKSDAEKNRFFKMFPNKIFKKYKYSIYIDGSIKIMTDLTEFVHDINKYGLKAHGHYRNSCVYDEIKKCKKLRKDTDENLTKHFMHLKASGMPKKFGLLEAGILVREHHSPICISLMEEWWHEFSQYSKRDQISLPFVLWKFGINVTEVSTLGNDIYTNYAFRLCKKY